MSFFDALVDVVVAPVKVTVRVAEGAAKATLNVVTLEPEKALRQVEKTAEDSERIVLKAIDGVTGADE